MRETRGGDRRLLRRERDLGAGRAAQARPRLRRSRRRVRLRAARADGGRRRQPRGRLLALRDWLRGSESRLGSVTGGNGSIYAVRRVGLRRGRSALRPRPLVPVPDGAARAARRLRPGGAGLREADADERGRVPAQGAHVRALLADRRCAAGCCAGSRPATGSRSSRTGTSATRAACSTSCCSATSIALAGEGLVYDVVLAAQLCLLAAAAVGVGIARYYVLVTWATVRRALELPAPRRARDVGGGGGHALNRALDVAIAGAGLASRAPCSALAALAVKLEDGGPVLYRQTRVGKDGVDFELLKLRTMVVGAETAGRRATRSTGATRGSRGSAASCAGSRSTSCRSSGTSCAAT